ncbi:hypothetical protein ACWNYQ_00460 [Candidatus Vidania fulgoroideorum]
MLIKLIDSKGKYLGILEKSSARDIAFKEKNDLICINDKLTPNIYKIGNIKKYIYNLKKKRKKIKNNLIKEIRINLEISENDYSIKMKKIYSILIKFSSIKIVILKRFRSKKNIIDEFINKIKIDIKRNFNFSLFYKSNIKNCVINICNAKKK